jgi:hypothetical protein
LVELLHLSKLLPMAKLSIRFVARLLSAAVCGAAWQRDNVKTGSWSGVIINSGCTADEAFAESDKCVEKRGRGARLSLYDDTIRQVYDLDAQDRAARYFGDSVTVKGTLHENAIGVSAIRKLTSIGLEPGQRAPAFSLSDQYDRRQDLDTLKGSNGTVLLFFRSADW